MKTMDELYKQCKKLQIFIFSKKNKKIKNLKKQRKKVRWYPHLYILLIDIKGYKRYIIYIEMKKII